MQSNLTIGPDRIRDDSECYVIAEIGCNHMGDVEKAKDMFSRAKECGANAVKMQKRDMGALFTSEMYRMPYINANSFGATYGSHREALEFGRDEYVELQRYAESLGITMFATPFDFPSADFLEDLGMPAYKTASADITNTPFLKYVAGFGKPMLVSTGGAAMEDVERAYDAVTPINSQVCLLQCTSSYPVEPEDMNLRVIETYRARFPGTVIGLSDHQNGIAMGPGRLHVGGTCHREALHDQPRLEGDRPALLARANRPAEAGERPAQGAGGPGRRGQASVSQRGVRPL